jgi:hypothetical protein
LPGDTTIYPFSDAYWALIALTPEASDLHFIGEEIDTKSRKATGSEGHSQQQGQELSKVDQKATLPSMPADCLSC